MPPASSSRSMRYRPAYEVAKPEEGVPETCHPQKTGASEAHYKAAVPVSSKLTGLLTSKLLGVEPRDVKGEDDAPLLVHLGGYSHLLGDAHFGHEPIVVRDEY